MNIPTGETITRISPITGLEYVVCLVEDDAGRIAAIRQRNAQMENIRCNRLRAVGVAARYLQRSRSPRMKAKRRMERNEAIFDALFFGWSRGVIASAAGLSSINHILNG